MTQPGLIRPSWTRNISWVHMSSGGRSNARQFRTVAKSDRVMAAADGVFVDLPRGSKQHLQQMHCCSLGRSGRAHFKFKAIALPLGSYLPTPPASSPRRALMVLVPVPVEQSRTRDAILQVVHVPPTATHTIALRFCPKLPS